VTAKKILEGIAAVLGALCLFGLPVLTVGLIGWGGDELVSWIPVKPEEIHTFTYQAKVVMTMLGTSIVALIVSSIIFGVIWLIAMLFQKRANAIPEPITEIYRPVESNRIRVGMMVRKGGMQSLKSIEKELAKKNINPKK